MRLQILYESAFHFDTKNRLLLCSMEIQLSTPYSPSQLLVAGAAKAAKARLPLGEFLRTQFILWKPPTKLLEGMFILKNSLKSILRKGLQPVWTFLKEKFARPESQRQRHMWLWGGRKGHHSPERNPDISGSGFGTCLKDLQVLSYRNVYHKTKHEPFRYLVACCVSAFYLNWVF